MTAVRLGRLELPHPTRPAVAAADRGQDALFVARAALRRAHGVSQAAELQIDQLRALVDRLEREAKQEGPRT